jgi:hypothetical protein
MPFRRLQQAVTLEEEPFVMLVISHINKVYYATNDENGSKASGHCTVSIAAGAKGGLAKNQTAAKSRFCSTR